MSSEKPGPQLNIKFVTSVEIHIIKIRWSQDCLFFIMEITIPGKIVFILRQGPGYHVINESSFIIEIWHFSHFILHPTTHCKFMMTSSNGNIFHVTGPLCGEFTGHRWIPLTRASDAELWCFLWSASEQTVEYTNKTLVIRDGLTPIMLHCNVDKHAWTMLYIDGLGQDCSISSVLVIEMPKPCAKLSIHHYTFKFEWSIATKYIPPNFNSM